MKYSFFIVFIMAFSINGFSKSVTIRRLDSLEKRVQQLEAKIKLLNASKVKTKKTSSINGLRVKDEKNKIIESGSSRSISSSNKEPNSLSNEKKKEIMKQLDAYKKNRAKSQKILDEIMNENY